MNLNERVAIEVMGWKFTPKMPEDCYATDEECKNHWWFNDGWGWGCGRCCFNFNPTTDGNDMLRVIERMRDDGYHIRITNLDRPTCTFYREPIPYMDEREGLCVAIKDSDTLPEAVCLAALEAVKDD